MAAKCWTRRIRHHIDELVQEGELTPASLYDVLWKCDPSYASVLARLAPLTRDVRILRAARRGVFSQEELIERFT